MTYQLVIGSLGVDIVEFVSGENILCAKKADSKVTFLGLAFVMICEEIKKLPIEEKMRIMQALWEDMHEHYQEAAVSEQLVDFLKERQARVEGGQARLLDWEAVKFRIGIK